SRGTRRTCPAGSAPADARRGASRRSAWWWNRRPWERRIQNVETRMKKLDDAAAGDPAFTVPWSSFVRADAHLDRLVFERLDIAQRRLRRALIFPGGNVGELLVVTFAFAIWILVLLAEVASAAF